MITRHVIIVSHSVGKLRWCLDVAISIRNGVQGPTATTVLPHSEERDLSISVRFCRHSNDLGESLRACFVIQNSLLMLSHPGLMSPDFLLMKSNFFRMLQSLCLVVLSHFILLLSDPFLLSLHLHLGVKHCVSFLLHLFGFFGPLLCLPLILQHLRGSRPHFDW
jgi:hypothetical protein